MLDPGSYPLSADISGLLAYVVDQVTQADPVTNMLSKEDLEDLKESANKEDIL